jgi:hypothetical protein
MGYFKLFSKGYNLNIKEGKTLCVLIGRLE